MHKRRFFLSLTHWGRVTHICVDKLTIIGSDNGLSPDRRQAIIWTNAGLLSIGSLRTYFNENLIKIQQFSLMKMHVKMSSAKLRPYCPGLNVLIQSNCWSAFNYPPDKILTHLPMDIMAAISQTILLDAFSWMKMYEFRLRFHWILFLRVQSTIFPNWFK